MIILRVACNNLYMFKNFELDLTYNRQISHFLAENDRIFEDSKIKVRKNLIIMGANASGKTTFGKLLGLIMNFIYGKSLEGTELKLESVQYDKKANANFEVEFVSEDTAYLLKAVFRNYVLYTEELKSCKIYKSYDILSLRQKLNSSQPVSFYNADENETNAGFRSYAFSVSKNRLTEKIHKDIGFWFRFSEMPAYMTDYDKNSVVNVELINELLPQIDNSVEVVTRLYENGHPTNTYSIKFKNGEKLVVPNGDLRKCDKRLSHGTFEAIDFINMFRSLKSSGIHTFYIDELFAHMHPELESFLIWKALNLKPSNSQFFFTTHDMQMLKLNVPVNSFIFFRRNSEGFNEFVYPSDTMNKNDRKLFGYYENDCFGILPDYNPLDKFFDKI